MKPQNIFYAALAFGAGYLLFKKKETTPSTQQILQTAVPTGIPVVAINPANIHLITQTPSNPFAGNPGIGGL